MDGRTENQTPISNLAKAGATSKFSNGHCDLILFNIFFILIPINIKVLLILHTKFQPNIPSNFGERDLHAWVDVNFFRVDVYFQTAIET